jgi:DNA-binding CsgD family transcriptional regulator
MRTRDVAFIRKLCTLGLPPRALVLSLLPALRELIPAHSGGVFWVDGNGQMSGLYAERMLPPDAMAAYYERHYERRTDGFATAFAARAARSDPVSWHSFSEAERRTDYFRDVLAPLDAFHVLYGVLAQQERPFAQLSLYRGERDAAFARADADTLRGLLHYLAAGLADPDRSCAHTDASIVVEEALGVVTPAGRVVSASHAWRRLVRLAASRDVTPREAVREPDAIEAFLAELAAALGGAGARPREVTRDTAWGRFVVRAFVLQDERARRADQLALLVRREESRELSLVRGTGHSALSPQQREVALLLAQGKTNAEIADQLGLTLNTASYHVKQVYLRLEVNSRDAVQEQLLKRAHLDVAVGA